MNELQDDEYSHLVQSLNKEQKEFLYHVLHLIQIWNEPFYCFLSGGAGAGVGKSCIFIFIFIIFIFIIGNNQTQQT